MADVPLTFKSKSQLLAGAAGNVDSTAAEPSTCIDAEPYALQVLDDSMAPEFWSGCIILIDPTGRATDGSFVLARTQTQKTVTDTAAATGTEDGEYVFRQLHRQMDGAWVLAALDASYPKIQIDQQLSDVVGVIVQRAGRRRSQHKRYD